MYVKLFVLPGIYQPNYGKHKKSRFTHPQPHVSCTSSTDQLTCNFSDAADSEDIVIAPEVKPEPERVTKIVYIKRYINQTRQITKTESSKQEEGMEPPEEGGTIGLSLAITIGESVRSRSL